MAEENSERKHRKYVKKSGKIYVMEDDGSLKPIYAKTKSGKKSSVKVVEPNKRENNVTEMDYDLIKDAYVKYKNEREKENSDYVKSDPKKVESTIDSVFPKAKDKIGLKIEYSGKDNGYLIKQNGKDNDFISAEVFKNMKAKIEYIKSNFDEEQIKEIFEKNNLKKVMKVADPNLIYILAKHDIKFAKNYVHNLMNQDFEHNENLGYKMKYNLKGMKKNKLKNKLSFIQRLKIKSMARKNHKKEVAEYIPDEFDKKAFGALALAGAIGVGTGAVVSNLGSNHDNHNNENPTKYTDFAEPESKNTNNDVNHDINNDKDIRNEENDVNKEENQLDENEQKHGITIGDQIYVTEGTEYSEDSWGNGNKARIGEKSWRPSGDYIVDRVALQNSDGKLLANISDEGTNIDEYEKKFAENTGIDQSKLKEVAHIRYGDNGDTGWLYNISPNKLNVTKTYVEIQQENQNQNQEEQQYQQENNDLDR